MAGFMGGNHLGFGDYKQSTARKCTKGECFLAQMQAVVPWKVLIELIEHITQNWFQGWPALPNRWRQ
jgi:hypothetical protein